jgi:hypothetical protein
MSQERFMSNISKTIHVPNDSELARLLKETDETGLWLEQDGVTYRVGREHTDPWAEYDPEAVRAGMAAVAGALTSEQAEELKASMYQGREEGTHPADRP